MKDFFKSIEVLRRSEKVQISSKKEGIFVLDGLRKLYLARCQFSSLKILSLNILTNSVFQYSTGFIQIV